MSILKPSILDEVASKLFYPNLRMEGQIYELQQIVANLQAQLEENNNRRPKISKIYFDGIPLFSGNPETLSRFASVCENIIHNFYDNVDARNPQNHLILDNILAKITGEAAQKIAKCDLSSWALIKKALLDNYADKRDMGTLTRELYQINQQNNETAFDFLNRLEKHQNLIIAYLDTHTVVCQEATPVLKRYHEILGTKQCLDGLKNPLQQYVKSRKPASIDEIHNILMNEYQKEASYKNFSTISIPSSSQAKSKNFQPQFNRNQNNNFPQKNNSNNFGTANQANHWPTKLQNQNFYRPSGSNNVPTNQPIPMSGITRNTHLPRTSPQKFNLETQSENPEEIFEENQFAETEENSTENQENIEFESQECSAEDHSVFQQDASVNQMTLNAL